MMVSEVAEPVYPLEKAEFIRALATGHGRALIHVERCGADGVRDEILEAALFPKTYDTQCNGYGEKWLARLCTMARLVETVISGDHGVKGGDGALRCRLLKEFALQGHVAARPALREMCRFDPHWNDLLACSEILKLEGEEGFLFVADRIGERLLEDEDFWVKPWLVSELDEIAGDGRAMAILDRESPANPRIAAYHEAVLKDRARESPKPDPEPPPVNDVVGGILASTARLPRLPFFGQQATPEERRKVAALDFSSMGAIPLENYLSYFYRSGFPEFREEYLPLLGHPEERVRWRAHAVLSHHAEPQVRLAAYEALARGEVAFFVKLLRRSGLAEDVEPLLGAIHVPEIQADADEVHGVVGPLLKLVRENERMNDLRLAVWMYEYSSCHICRSDAVEFMVGRSILPQWIAEECLSDASEGIREMAEKYLGRA